MAVRTVYQCTLIPSLSERFLPRSTVSCERACELAGGLVRWCRRTPRIPLIATKRSLRYSEISLDVYLGCWAAVFSQVLQTLDRIALRSLLSEHWQRFNRPDPACKQMYVPRKPVRNASFRRSDRATSTGNGAWGMGRRRVRSSLVQWSTEAVFMQHRPCKPPPNEPWTNEFDPNLAT